MKNLKSTIFPLLILLFSSGIMNAQEVSLDIVESIGGCGFATDCETDFICFDIRMTVDIDKDLDSYNIWLQYDNTVLSRTNGGNDNSCVIDNGGDSDIEELSGAYRVAGIPGSPFPMLAGNQEIVHTICFSISDTLAIDGTSLSVGGSLFSGALPTSITFADGSTDAVEEVTPLVLSATSLSCLFQFPIATNNQSLANVAGPVTQQVVTEDDGDGVDSDPDGSLTLASVDLDPTTAGVQSSLIVAGEGTWSVDGAGNVTFAPVAGFTNDPTPINYTINDNDGNTSNTATITVDYVPVATADLSSGNTTNNNVTVDVLANDTDGDLVDPITVSLQLTGLPVDATCSATDAAGDCIEVTVPGQGVYSVNETTGAITFDPEVGFTANPDPITYTVKDDEGNLDSAILTIEFDVQAPTATNNESLANVAGNVIQQVVTEDDGNGVDSDPDGSLTLASVDLDPTTAGIQSSLIVAGEGTWSVDGAGNVTFAPEAGFTLDPTPINYTINDNDGNTSNTATIIVDYVPVATADLSSGNTTNNNVTVDVLANDTDGDLVDPTTVSLQLTGLPVDATCSATDAAGDCIEVTVPGQGVYSVNETTGAITFDPEVGFTANPDPITYSVKDDEGNLDSAILTIEFDVQAPTATNNESLANVAGNVIQQVVTEDDGDGVDSDPDGSLTLASVDLDPATAGIQSSLIVAGEGTWSVDGAGNVTFAPVAGFTNDPTPIDYTINDNDGNTSNTATIIVDYVPVATDDLSSGNTTNNNVIVDVLANDTDGDLVDPTTVSLQLTGLPVDATCSATDAAGDCIEVTVPGQGVYSVNETTGAITFDPEVGFTANPDPITYSVKDDEGNLDSAILTIEFDVQAPTATNNQSLANVAGDVTQQVVTEDDGDGVDSDPDGSLSFASVDLDPTTAGVQSSLIVAGQGTWSVDGAGNVTFAPEAGFTLDPTPINYTINDNDGNTSNTATITVDYVPVATADLSSGNTTNNNVTVDVLANDTDGDLVDPITVSLQLTGLPVDATCSATDAAGDCIEVTVPGQGVYSVNETTGAITFDPEVGFTANPDPITYSVKDDEGNLDSAILTIEFDVQAPTATNNQSLANVAGDVTQQVVTEDDGDGVDSDPDGSLSFASVDLDPTTAGVQSSLIVAGQGTWSVDGVGNVTFAPEAGFTLDPTPINYTINDNDGNTSNTATITVDYVPVATADLSSGNTTNNNVTVDVLANDTDGDLVDPITVSLQLTGLPVDATCSATDAAGDCIEVTVPGQGVYSVNETTGAITFDPEVGFTANPDPITYSVKDDEGNLDSAILTIEFDVQAPTATNNESLANVAGNVIQQVVTEDDGNGVDSDPDGSLTLASVDLDPTTAGIQSSLIVAGQGTWSVDGAGNVTFAPEAGFTLDPTPINYTINDNDGNTSNTATITVDYVPVATADLSSGNTTNNNVTVDVLANDTDGDLVDPITVSLQLTGLPVDATCSATDAAGDCIEVTVPGQGVYSVNETTGAITFDPEVGFTANPDPITYSVKDDEGNLDSAILTIEFDVQAPTATNNESLANVAGNVIQQVVTEDDGNGVDSDPDGSLTLASVDLDPTTAGIQSSLIVAGEGTWSVDGAGNVTFAPVAGFTNDPTPINYTINDNDGNTSNTATITVDYVPVATADLSSGNTTNNNVTVDVLANDTDGDLVDPITVSLQLTGLPVDATCSATDAAGDCIEVTVPGQGVYSVNETTGAITFDPEVGFTANPDPITYTVKDDEGNLDSAILTIEFDVQAPTATNNESLANVAGNVIQQVVTEDDGNGVDSDPDGSLTLASVDLDPTTAGIQSSLIVAGEGTWSVDGAGNVTFAPEAGFTLDPTPINYTINDNDGNTSNTATIIVDYVPVATADLSSGNTTNNNVTVDVLANDTDGDLVDPTTVSLQLTGLPVDATCSATDAAGDCIEVTVPGQGVYSVNETTGAITFDPEVGFTANPDPITYSVKDDEGNLDSAILTIEFDVQAPTATNNESLANVAGNVIQQVVTEDDGDGVDSDPDGSLTLASVDLDPATAGIQSSLIVAGEGTWSVDGAGNVTFAPVAGFTNDPTPIDYTINDNDGNTSNTATIIVDYVPVATDDLSSGNTTNNNVIVDVLANDTDGDLVDPTTVSLQLTGLPVDATCSATDAAGDCIEVTVPGQGVYSVNETTGAITFDPEVGFTANPDPITYSVKDDEGNLDSAILTIEFDVQAPTATNNQSLANVAGDVTQQVVTEDDGDGVDSDPDGSLSFASVDLDPTTAGVQSSLIVAGQGTWSVDGVGNVTFAPEAGFTLDPTPINYTINDNDGNTSNTATITVDYVPVATADLSSGNTTNNNVTVDVLANDTDGDLVDPITVSLQLTGLPVDATCSATDAAGDCIEVTVPGQGVYSVNETTGAITFDPEVGFTANPDPITYSVKDDEGNLDSAILTIEFDVQAPTATNNESLANVAGNVIQQVVTEDDGNGVDSDPDGSLTLASVDLDPTTAGIQSSLIVAGQGTWSVDGAGNVTFAPVAGFTNDPTPIDYTINDNDGNTSNTATITVDYVPVATADLSSGNTTNNNVTVDVLANDTDGDLVDPTTVSLQLTGLPVDATCSATDAAGDCIEVTVPGQGVYSVNETTGAITFDPEVGFTANPDPITYSVKDDEGNLDSAILTIEFDVQAPIATNNESLANVAGNVIQQVVTEDDGNGVDSDPDGSLTLASVDLDPTTAGVQSSLIVAGQGTWSVDGVGNVTFAPEAGFTLDPTPINYTINDNDGNTSNTATIIVDYVPVATADLSSGNTTNNNVTVDVLANDTDGDLVDPTTVSLQLTGLPVDATCSATDAAGDCIEVTVPGQGVYSVNETTGAITFDPEVGFTANPDPITYSVKDDEGNLDSAILTIEFDVQAPTATNNQSLANVAGDVTQQVVTEDDGDGVDSDPDGSLSFASVDLDPTTAGVQSSLIVAGQGTWSVDGVGNVTFAPVTGFTLDPTPINYTINDNDGNTSNTATITVDYVPVATADLSSGNTTNNNVTVDVLANDTDGDLVDPTTVSLQLTGLPVDATCSATDAAGDCIEVTVPGQGVYSVNETTGAITFDPEVGFTANPDPITYSVKDDEGNLDSAILTIEFDVQAPIATNNESLANVAGNVIQQVVTEDDGNGVDSDPDGSLTLASVDLDPTTAGVQSSLIVAGEGTWSVDGAGNVTFAPIAGFTNDPTPINYTINDNDGNTSNTATIIVDYVPVATNDLSSGNTTNNNVIVDILANDTDGDLVDPTTVSLQLTGLPVDATCSATDAGGDCIEVTVPGQGVYSVDETTGAITFDPETGFTANPDPITYTVKDDEGNSDTAVLTIEFDVQAPTATNNESLANAAGDVTQQVVTEDDGDGIDVDPDGALTLASVDLDPTTAGVQSSLIVAGQGTWSVDGAGNVTFAPVAGFTLDPTPINYTINDNDGNTSNTATIIVDYVPVATNDLSSGNTTNNNVTVDVLANDTDGDLVDPTTVSLELTGLPAGSTCSATDAAGDCIEVTVPGQGVWSVDETTGAITFDPEVGFTANPDPITYTVKDDEGNPDSAILTIEFDVQTPTATNNESLANVAGNVTQQVVTEDDGDGIDADPDGSLSFASVDLDPSTAGVQSTLIVAGEGTWTVDGAGNVTFAPIAGFTNDPTPINYTINDNDGNTSNTATIIVDYVPVATNDLSSGNTTNNNVIVDILANDTDGDLVDPITVSLQLTGLPVDATCSATDAAGDCIEVTVPGQGVYSVDETTGAITFDPETGFTANPDPITYTVKDDEGNSDTAVLTIEFDVQAPTATNNQSLANAAGDVTQQVVTEDDGDGVDSDPDGSLSFASVDLDPTTAGVQSSLIVAGQGTWSVDGVGNVTFAPVTGFTLDPTPINYTINDNDGNTSNTATITVDYVPVATADLSSGNTTNNNVTVDVLANDTDGDLVDPTTVSLQLTGLPVDATCSATDAAGDCIEVTVPGQGVYSVNETTGAITFDPEVGFTANPDPITYSVKDDEGNLDSAILTIEFDVQAPIATNNESLANVAGNVIQQVVTEDDGNGVDSDPDGSLTLASVDLDPTTAGVQSSLIVAGEGTWSVDGAGNVTFAPIAGFTNDPTPINYTINDNDGNTSNTATIVVDYVPVATDDLSSGNTTNNNVTVDVLVNDTDGDLVDATTVSLELTGLPTGSTCTATDAAGDCIEVTVPGQGVWSVDETTGAITFDPEVGFTANPDPITYTVEDNEGNPDSAILTIEFDVQAPTATYNESLANAAGPVTQEVIAEDDGDGVDSDPDGLLNVASIDLDPTTPGNDKAFVVAGEGTWTEDGAGNVTFTPIAGFTLDPTPIVYTISDNDGNISNADTILVDYVPVAANDESLNNTTNTAVIVDILVNDITGDVIDIATIQIVGTTNPGDDLVVAGEGTWSINPTTGEITFTPIAGFTANPTDVTYTAEDHEGNQTSAIINIEYTPQAPTATYNESLANAAGPVTQEVIAEDDGDGVDSDPDGLLNAASIDLDPTTPGNDKAFVVAGEGTWTEDGAGNVTFTPIAGFTLDPTPIVYTISDNDGNISNADTILVDYVPVAANDESLNNTTNTAVIVDILVNDITGDVIDIATIQIVGTTNPGDDLVVAGEGTWSINPTTGEITFTPIAGFTANPTDVTYTAEDHEGNQTSAIINIEYTPQAPTATNNESLANLPGSVTQQVVTEDDGNGVDFDPDGALSFASVDLDPTTAGIQSSLIVAGEGTWSVDGAGNVTFVPIAGFTYDPSLIEYTINDNDGNTSNTASIYVDYVPVATDDLSTGNTINTNVTVNVLENDIEGDLANPQSVTLELTGLPVDATCTAIDASGDCIEVTVPAQGVWSVNEVSGAITFDPEDGFIADPDPITYTIEDLEGNPSSAVLTIEYEGCLKLNLRVYLEGALINNGGATGDQGSLMRDDLRSSPYEDVIGINYLPVNEPYTAMPSFTHVGDGGGEVATSTAFDTKGENSVVDWVFLELRDKLDSTSVILTRSALLQRDGDVVDIDGVSPLLWCGLPDDTYYVVVRHRNHIGVMTSLPEVLTTEGTLVDFTNGNSSLSGEYNFGINHPEGGASGYDYTGLSQKSYLGVRALWLGNAAHNDKVKYESPGDDKSQILFDVLLYPTNSTFQGAYDFGFGYFSGDLNMDSKVKYEAPGDDQSILLFQILLYPLNNTFQSAFDFMYEQIPNN